jgi:hypothetical protein
MNYLLLSDILWYLGHILTGCSIIFTKDDHYLAILFVLIGQSITIISRPIGRIKNPCYQKIQSEQQNIEV